MCCCTTRPRNSPAPRAVVQCSIVDRNRRLARRGMAKWPGRAAADPESGRATARGAAGNRRSVFILHTRLIRPVSAASDSVWQRAPSRHARHTIVRQAITTSMRRCGGARTLPGRDLNVEHRRHPPCRCGFQRAASTGSGTGLGENCHGPSHRRAGGSCATREQHPMGLAPG